MGEPEDPRPGGRPRIDWEQAFLFYAALPPQERSYRAVADAYPGVSVRTVERHGRDDRWKERARRLDREATEAAAERLRAERAQKLIDEDRLLDAAFLTIAEKLRERSIRVTLADLPRLHKLRTTIADERDATTQTAIAAIAEPAGAESEDPAERKLKVLRALHEAGGLSQLLGLPDSAGPAGGSPERELGSDHTSETSPDD